MLIDIVHSKTSLSLSTSFILYPFVIMTTRCCSIHHESIDKGLYDRLAISFLSIDLLFTNLQYLLLKYDIRCIQFIMS